MSTHDWRSSFIPAVDPPPARDPRWSRVLAEVFTQANLAELKWGPFASQHEAYGVLAEEVAELFDEVRKKQGDPTRLPGCRQEAIDVAVVALRIVYQLTEGT